MNSCQDTYNKNEMQSALTESKREEASPWVRGTKVNDVIKFDNISLLTVLQYFDMSGSEKF